MRYRAACAGLLIVAALVVAACGGGNAGSSSTASSGAGAGKAPKMTQVKVGIIPIADLLQLFVAQQKGYFADEGLKVSTQAMAGGAAIAPAVQSGSLDLGWSNVASVIIAHEKGLNFQLIGGGTFLAPGHQEQAILVPKGSPINSPKDLIGRQVAVNTLGNINELEVKSYLRDAGVDPAQVKLMEVPFPDQPAALSSGHVAAAAAVEPFVTLGVKQGDKVLASNPFASFGKRPIQGAWFTTSDWLKQHATTAHAFMRAIDKATRFIEAHPGQAANVLPKNTKIKASLATQIKLPIYDASITSGDLEPWIRAAKEFGLVTHTFDPSEILWAGRPQRGG